MTGFVTARARSSLRSGTQGRPGSHLGAYRPERQWLLDLQRSAGNRAVQRLIEGLGDTSEETIESVDDMFRRAELKARAEEVKKKHAQARVEVTRLIRARFGREYVEGPDTVNSIIGAAISRGYPVPNKYDNLPQRVDKAEAQKLDNAEKYIETAETALFGPLLTNAVDTYAQDLGGRVSRALQQKVGTTGLEKGIADRYRKTVNLGELRSYYQSRYDKDEGYTYGFSYDLDNSSFVVHVHTAGSGTVFTAVSIKSRTNEGGPALISTKNIGGKLRGRIVEDVERNRDNPKAIIRDIKSGADPRWTRAGI